ncbi:inactive dipeptidyl peptidase 10-like isoform X1 [Teleopsis dalmanni]|uniref:inactive dipeptidyl peptidase 10-like isoform X1 n=1 Tax=Teleopsis dalmanni TaxID=139649 RepID=UPI0018CDFC2C|nr:inactive dipeptidyl peptidase 10-like isoform X1 [Teleopsis dalmanni]
MVEIQKPTSVLKRPSQRKENAVVNNNSAPMKKVTLPKDEELVAISPERRNWRGIFIALLVIAAVFSLIIFSIFLLTPEDEGLHLRGRHLILNDILGKSLRWKPFNGTWNNDVELIYRDPSGGLSILNLDNYTTRVLMTNSTFRQLNAETFLVSPDQKYVLLQSDSNVEGSRNHVYEVQTANTFPLGPTENSGDAPRLQYVIWAPTSSHIVDAATVALATSKPQSTLPSSITAQKFTTTTTATTTETATIKSSLLATDTMPTISSVPATGSGGLLNSLATVAAAMTAEHEASKSTPFNFPTQSNANHADDSLNQAIAFVYENDIYYKPKVQGELVCRITTTGQSDVVYNGIPDWTYEHVPELSAQHSNIVFSPDGLFMAFLTFNDSAVDEYKYTWMGEGIKYPTIRTQRYPKAGAINPNITVNVVNLSVLHDIVLIPIKLPADMNNGSYIGSLVWATAIDLSLTVTNREQTKASTVFCRAPNFDCQVLHTETTIDNGWVLPAEFPIFSIHLIAQVPNLRYSNNVQNSMYTQQNTTNGQRTFEIIKGGFLLKRLPVRDGEHGYYRHVVFISSLDRRTVPLTMGRFEVTEIVGWDETNKIVYFMAAPEKRPAERHLYKISLKLNITETNRTYIASSTPTCLTCDNTASTFKLVNTGGEHHSNDSDEEDEDNTFKIPKNCLYNKIYFSKKFSYYVQECLGPDSPSVYLVETHSNTKIFVLDSGADLRHRLEQLAIPQIKTFSVEIRHGFHAQVRLFLPPGMREDDEVAFPLILHVDAAPGSQSVTEKFDVDWNWYLSSQRSMIVAQIDARGSGYQGELLRTQVHGKLGTVEVEDQLGVLTYLRDNLKFVDPSRICAFGWGYGGYATIMALIEDSQQVLQCAVAINPLVSFGYHYSFFTERYIPFRGDYLRALQEADLTMKAGNIKDRNLMLMHGTADTFVHQEHTLMLVRSLVDQQVKFRHQIYPDDNHALTKSLSHVYKTMEWYFDECFGPNDDNDWDPTGLFVFKQ